MRTFLPLDDLKLYLIAFLQAFIPLSADRAVVNKNIGTILPPDKAEPFCIVEPLYGSFQT